MTAEEHDSARSAERSQADTDDSDCWAMLATVYTTSMFGLTCCRIARTGRQRRGGAVDCRRRALASPALAPKLVLPEELDACRPVAERALNPMDGAIGAFIGLLQALSGDWERAVWQRRRRKLNHFGMVRRAELQRVSQR